MGWVTSYAEPIGNAAVVFAVICAVLAVPYLAWQYRRRGTVAAGRAWAQTSFLLYLMCAWALVLMPFPDDPCRRTVDPQLQPFHWLDLARAGSTGTASFLTNVNTVMFVFNVALLFPLGVYLRRWFGQGLLMSALAGLAMSLAFEVTQYTANFGLFECTYRQFNVDDLMANTAGAILGWLLAPLVFIVPRKGDDPVAPDRVTVPRRALACGLDFGIALILTFVATSLAETFSLPVPPGPMYLMLLFTCAALPALTGGRTPGQFSVGIRIQPRNPIRVALRAVLVWAPYPGFYLLSEYGLAHRTDPLGVAALLAAGLCVLWPLVLLTRVHERISGTRAVPDGQRDRYASTSVGSVG